MGVPKGGCGLMHSHLICLYTINLCTCTCSFSSAHTFFTSIHVLGGSVELHCTLSACL